MSRPADLPTLSKRAARLMKRRRFAEALAVLDQILALNPADTYALVCQGQALGHLQRHAEALAAFERALAINSNDSVAWANRGIALQNLHRYAEAIASFDCALMINPSDMLAWQHRSTALRFASPQTNPIALIRGAEGVDIRVRKLPRGYSRSYGDQLLTEHHDKEALLVYDSILEHTPQDALVWRGRGIALFNLERFAEAVASLQRALETEPDDSIARDYLTRAASQIPTRKRDLASGPLHEDEPSTLA